MMTGCNTGCKTLQCVNDNVDDDDDSDHEDRNWYAARLAANAYFDLSQEEKDRADGDLYGTEEPIEETPEFVQSKLEELDREVNRLSEHTKKYYAKALHLEQELLQAGGKEYVGSPQFRLMFLRADLFDARKAAKRLAYHFKAKYEVFGEEILPRKITYSDLNEDERVALISGGFTYTGAVDDSGRPILIFCNSKVLLMPNSCTSRVSFYIAQTIIEGNEVAQRKGLVSFGYNMGFALRDPLVAKRLFPLMHMALKAFPARIAATHNFYDDQLEHLLINLTLVVMPNRDRTRYLAHFITQPEEFFYNTLRFGINPDDLPITESTDYKYGELNYEMIREFWEKQNELENNV